MYKNHLSFWYAENSIRWQCMAFKLLYKSIGRQLMVNLYNTSALSPIKFKFSHNIRILMNEMELVLTPSKFMWKNVAINNYNTLVLDDDDYMGICRHSGSIDKTTAEHIRSMHIYAIEQLLRWQLQPKRVIRRERGAGMAEREREEKGEIHVLVHRLVNMRGAQSEWVSEWVMNEVGNVLVCVYARTLCFDGVCVFLCKRIN